MRQLDIIVPCYNPLPNWAETIIVYLNNLKKLLSFTELHLYLVNDGSSQGINSSDLALLKASLDNFTYISLPKNMGKGYALRKGVELANHDFFIYTDVDFPYLEESFIQVYNALLEDKNDVVVGIRDENYYLEMTGFRAVLSKLLKLINNKLFQLPINDTQCGIKGFNRNGRDIFLKTVIPRYLFDLEYIFLATHGSNIKLTSVPVKLRAGVTFRKFDLKILFTEGSSFIKFVISSFLQRSK
ncbi:glycosyltransferase family 2 protein [Adhaeribacter aquaticus]|uniref:glycosyltransferase family 2 protein n=1 Tax=Adhaeribacter aquaticus TaxID=299567 RepID=UPI0004016FF9|nr:glycosyltransferase family 2 protein [Adhaeribacter aquaticus]